MAKVTYYSGTEVLPAVFPEKTEKFLEIGGVKSKHNSYDSFSRLCGSTKDGKLMPVTRKIFYASNPSLHKCGPKCRNAKGHDCECSCGGKFHGAGV